MKNSDHKTRDDLLHNFQISDNEILNNLEINTHVEDKENGNGNVLSTQKNINFLGEKDSSQISVYVKPSIYIPTPNKPADNSSSSSSKHRTSFQYFHSPLIIKYISNFFKWKYLENNCYIYRESFFTDFFRDKDDLKESLNYCNEELIFAICASGSKIDFGDGVFLYKGVLYDSPEKFYNRARYLLFQKLHNEECNTMTSIQTFLCLAFFDLGRGKVLSAWILAGIAFRIGMHMGFELNLNYYQNQNGNENGENATRNKDNVRTETKSNGAESTLLLNDFDMNVKCRIYWGCLVADYYLSFILGRSPTLEHLPTTIPQSKDLPILPGIDFFLYYDPVNNECKIFNISKPLERLNAIYKIVNRYQKLIYNDNLNSNDSGNRATNFQVWHNLDHFNLEIYEWKAKLIDELYWTRAELKITGYNPNLMSFRYQYYLILLSFNRDFVNIYYNDTMESSTSPRNICINSIEDVYNAFQCFKLYHSFKFASLNMVYLSILSISIIEKLPATVRFPHNRITLIDFFATVLKECSDSWELAKNAYRSFLPFLRKVNLNHHTELPEKTEAYKFIPGKNRPEEDVADFDESLIPSLNYA